MLHATMFPLRISFRNLAFGVLAAVVLLASSFVQAADERAAARRLWDAAHQNQLDGQAAEEAAALLSHDDPFLRGLAEWALAMKVGHENNGQTAAWPGESPPAWFQRWRAIPAETLIEMDWVRQAISAELDRDAAQLLDSVDVMLERGRRMQAAFLARGSGDERGPRIHAALSDLEAARKRLADIRGQAPADAAEEARQWLAARRALRTIALANPAVDFEEILLATHYAPHTPRNITRTFSWQHKPGGDLLVVNPRDPAAPVRALLGGRLGPGHVRNFDLWWDADRLVFSFAPQPYWPPAADTTTAAGEGTAAHELRKTHPPLKLFEMSLDGSGLHPRTSDPYWNDFEPAYCADGSIVFASDRCARAAECGPFEYDIANPNLYRLTPGAGEPLRVTDSKDLDRHPCALNDGRLVYTHWEYQERHFMEVHSLWSARPDGRVSDALFKQHLKAPLALRAARPVPRSGKLVAIATGHHTFAYGSVVLIDPRVGINAAEAIEIVTPGVRLQEGTMAGSPPPEGGVRDDGGLYQTPYALSEDCFLVSYAYARPKCSALGGVDSNGFAVYLIDVYGNRELLYRDPLLSCSQPMPIAPRPRPPILPEVEPGEERGSALCYVADVYQDLEGVPRGAARYLRVAQHVGWPLDCEGGMAPYFAGPAYGKQFGYWSWSPVRVLGTVPVHEDGSASFRVPADTAVYFQLLDERFMELRRMRSFVSLQHGEVRGCRGCHETQDQTLPTGLASLKALQQPPADPVPPPWGSERLLGYEWLVQPVLDRHCVRCHGGEKTEGDIDLSGQREADGMLRSFHTMFAGTSPTAAGRKPLVSVADRFGDSSVTRPLQFGSHRSPLVTVLLEDPLHAREVAMDGADWYALVTWVDCNAPYYDRFIDKRPSDGGPPRRDIDPLAATRSPEAQDAALD